MSDHDFEKQVQQRLEQLKLRPSNAVWAEVERNIRLQKRRRRLLIWLPAALLVMIAGGYLALQQTTRQEASSAQTAQSVEITVPATTTVSPNQSPSTDNSTSTPAHQPGQDNTSATPAQADRVTDNPVSPTLAHAKADAPAVTATKPVLQPGAQIPVTVDPPSDNRLATKRPSSKHKKPARHIQQPVDDLVSRQPTAAAILPVMTAPAPVTKQVDAEAVQTAQQDSVAAIVPVADAAIAMATPVDSASVDTAKGLATPPVVTTTPAIAQTAIQPKKDNNKESKWQFGVNAEGGASGVSSDGLLGFLEKKEAVPDLAAAPNYNFAGNTVTLAPQFPRPPVNRASSLSMGPAFSIGGFAQRKLSNRLSLSAGIQYTLLSARQVVGNKINNDRTVNRAPATSQLVTSYYDNSAFTFNTYTNKYHFVEIPVILHAQLNEGKRLPFGMDIGFAASRMVKTTALHYDGIGNVYYKDDALFNKTQWTASAGFYVKLFNKSSHPLSVGPMMRYNMTPMLVKDFSTGQHLWSVGLRARVLLKK